MVLCNICNKISNYKRNVTILILIDGFLQYKHALDAFDELNVTILILIDGFLQ